MKVTAYSSEHLDEIVEQLKKDGYTCKVKYPEEYPCDVRITFDAETGKRTIKPVSE